MDTNASGVANIARTLPSCIPGAVANSAPPVEPFLRFAFFFVAVVAITVMLSCYLADADMEGVVGDKWIKGAVKNKGALRRALGTPEGESISAEKLKTIKTKLRKKGQGDKKLSLGDRKLLRRVQLALSLRGYSKS
mgnify:CR=1 FL=1